MQATTSGSQGSGTSVSRSGRASTSGKPDSKSPSMLCRRSVVMIASANPIPLSATFGKAEIGMSLPRQIPCRSANCKRTARTPTSANSVRWLVDRRAREGGGGGGGGSGGGGGVPGGGDGGTPGGSGGAPGTSWPTPGSGDMDRAYRGRPTTGHGILQTTHA